MVPIFRKEISRISILQYLCPILSIDYVFRVVREYVEGVVRRESQNCMRLTHRNVSERVLFGIHTCT